MAEEAAPVVAEAPAPVATAPEPAAAAPAPATIAGGKVPPADKPGTIAEGGDVQTGDPEVKGTWPDDWREKIAGGDQDLAKMLKRFGSPGSVAKALKETRAQVSKGGQASLPDDATDEDKAEWRKARGVPDAPEGYDVAPPAGVEWTPEDKAYLGSFMKTAHDQGIPKAQFQALAQQYIDAQIAQQQEQNLAVQKYQITAIKALRAEYGKDFDGTAQALLAYGQRTFTPKGWEDIVNSTMPNGAKLGDNPVFVKYLVDIARDTADANAPFEIGSIKGGVSDADTKKAHMALIGKAANGDKAARAQLSDPDYEAKIRKLYEREAKAQSRAA